MDLRRVVAHPRHDRDVLAARHLAGLRAHPHEGLVVTTQVGADHGREPTDEGDDVLGPVDVADRDDRLDVGPGRVDEEQAPLSAVAP